MKRLLKVAGIGIGAVAALVVAAFAVAWVATAPPAMPADTETGRRLAPGPHAVGLSELVWVDGSRPTPPNGDHPGSAERRLAVALWHPVDAAGSHPLLVYNHGFMSTRHGGRYLAEHLASHGYVVVAADFPLTHFGALGGPNVADVRNQPGDVSFLIDRALALGGAERPFAGSVDPERIGVFGLSLGGMTTSLVAFHPGLRDPRLRAAVSIAGPGAPFTARFYEHADLPFLMVAGTADAMIDYDANAAPLPARLRRGGLVTLAGASHAGFDDLAAGPLRVLGNMDRLGCRSLLANLDLDADPNPFAEIASPELGVVDPGDGMLPCRRPYDAAMAAGLQHQLTTVALRAFFDALFAAEPAERDAAAAFLERTLPAERAEVSYAAARLGP